MRRLTASFCTAVAILAAPAACAQAEDTVIITATRFPDTRRDLPVGVTLITADDLRRSASSNLAEILAQSGLLQIRDNAGTPNAQIDLRGFGATGDQNTLVLLDGVRISENEQLPAQLSRIPLEAIERIEILRGGGAVLYGGGASGGTINVITRRPRAGETSAYALGRAGGYGTRELRAGLARHADRFGLSLALSDEDTEGYRRNNRYQQTNLAGNFDARGGDLRAYVRLGYEEQRLRLPGSLTEAQIAADPRQTLTPDDYSRRHGGQVVFGGAWRSGRSELSADLAYRDRRANAFFALFGGFYTDTRAESWSFAPRAKLAFDALGRGHEVVLGADFERWDYATRSAASAAAIGTPFSQRTGELSNAALYAQGSFWVGPATRIVGGARVQRHRDRLAEQVFPTDERSASRTLQAYELAARHGFGSGWWGYARAGRSFRAANFDDNACFFPPCAERLLEPQTARAAELGAEYEGAGLRARAAAYAMRLRNEIYFSPLLFANINLSPTYRRGLELEAAWRASPDLELKAALALLAARFRSGSYAGVDVSGRDVPLVPKAIATAAAAWQFAPRSRANASLRWVGRQRYDNDQANTFSRRQPGYVLAGFKLEHRVGRVELALEVSNLFDRRYYSYGVWNFADSFSAFPAPGRALYGTLSWRLD
ncbi:MAG: TonB-dependent receptor [Betaproteobacteria bacterium]|nr:MAG: TonB-dependent receptor [Betaproteobacteria bacterium]